MSGWHFIVSVNDEEPHIVASAEALKDYVRGTKLRLPDARIAITIKQEAVTP